MTGYAARAAARQAVHETGVGVADGSGAVLLVADMLPRADRRFGARTRWRFGCRLPRPSATS